MRSPPGLPSRDCPGALWADLTLEEGGRGDGRCRRRLPQQTDSSVPGMPKTGCRCRVHAIAPHWPGGVGTPALASPTGRERKSLRGVGLTRLLFSHWLEERRDQGTRPGAREASEAPVSPRSAPVSPRSAPAATRPPSFSCGAWARRRCQGRGAWGRATLRFSSAEAVPAPRLREARAGPRGARPSAEVKATPESHGGPPRLAGDLARGPQAWAGCC